MAKHAFLSASSAHRWLECPPSAKACEGRENQASPYAQQGTDCHELCAYLLEKSLGKDVADPTKDLEYYNQEMQDCAESYCTYVNEQIEEAKMHCADSQILIEQRLNFSRWVENGFGTGDCVIVSDDVLQVIDYKHGLGVLVSAMICAHVHDELIIECRKDVSLAAVCGQMGRTPPWAEGLVLKADGFETPFYKKD